MHVETYGSGSRRFIAFHGWGGDHREFAAVASHRPEGVRLESVDLPGYGASAAPEKLNLDDMVQQMAEELQPLSGVTLAGYCSGAIFAMLLARQQPDEVSRLVLIDPFAYVPWYFRIFLAGGIGRRAYAFTFARPQGRSLVNRILRWRHSPDDDFTGSFARVNHDTVLNYLRMFGGLSLRDFAGLRVPVDLVFGARTFSAVRDSVGRFQRLWPHARTFELSGMGHLPMVRGARDIARILFGDERS